MLILLRRALWVAGSLFVLILGTTAGLKTWWDVHYLDRYNPSRPLHATVISREERPDYRRIAFAFDSVPGQRVPGLLALPKTGKGPFPCVVFLYGIGQSKEFLDDIAGYFTREGFAIVTFDQYTRGARKLKHKSGIQQAAALRRRASLNVIETRRLVDYLDTRPDIAPNRIYMDGASFGAITGATAAAFEPRLRAIVLTYGGGDLPVLFASRAARHTLGKWTHPLAVLAAFLYSPGDPIKYIGKIAPRPILFQNGKNDSLIPPASARALYNAAGQPKQIVWYSGDHIGTNPATLKKVIRDAVAWLKARDAEIVKREGSAKPAPRHAAAVR